MRFTFTGPTPLLDFYNAISLKKQSAVICVCFYLYVSAVSLIDYSDIDKMIDISNEKC
jgi:hypothetical protein